MRRTHVMVHKVTEAGLGGQSVGTGSLIHPRLVLLHPPLGAELTPGAATLMARVEPADGSATHDIRGSQVLLSQSSADAEPFAALLLDSESTAPVSNVGSGELTAHPEGQRLSSLGDELAAGRPEDDESFLCTIWGYQMPWCVGREPHGHDLEVDD